MSIFFSERPAIYKVNKVMRLARDALESADPGFLDYDSLQRQPQFASTLANGLALLGCFGQRAALWSNKELSEQLQLMKPTVTRLTFTLMGLGYLRRDKASGRYALGPAVLSLGYPLLSQMAIRQIAAPEMLALTHYAKGPVSIGMRDRLQVVYVETVTGQDSNFTKPGIGSTRPLLRTAMGRALLYQHTEQERQHIYKGLKAAQQEEFDKFLKPTERAYEQIKQQGFCSVVGDWQAPLAAVAVPLSTAYNGVHLAFNLTVATYAVAETELQKNLGPRLVHLVRSVERALGLSV